MKILHEAYIVIGIVHIESHVRIRRLSSQKIINIHLMCGLVLIKIIKMLINRMLPKNLKVLIRVYVAVIIISLEIIDVFLWFVIRHNMVRCLYANTQ